MRFKGQDKVPPFQFYRHRTLHWLDRDPQGTRGNAVTGCHLSRSGNCCYLIPEYLLFFSHFFALILSYLKILNRLRWMVVLLQLLVLSFKSKRYIHCISLPRCFKREIYIIEALFEFISDRPDKECRFLAKPGQTRLISCSHFHIWNFLIAWKAFITSSELSLEF